MWLSYRRCGVSYRRYGPALGFSRDFFSFLWVWKANLFCVWTSFTKAWPQRRLGTHSAPPRCTLVDGLRVSGSCCGGASRPCCPGLKYHLKRDHNAEPKHIMHCPIALWAGSCRYRGVVVEKCQGVVQASDCFRRRGWVSPSTPSTSSSSTLHYTMLYYAVLCFHAPRRTTWVHWCTHVLTLHRGHTATATATTPLSLPRPRPGSRPGSRPRIRPRPRRRP